MPLPSQESGHRIQVVLDKLWASVTDDRGYGGPLSHHAVVDGWAVRATSGDDGTVFVGASGGASGPFKFYEMTHYPDYPPTATTRDCTDGDLPWLADLLERAEWKDRLRRNVANEPLSAQSGLSAAERLIVQVWFGMSREFDEAAHQPPEDDRYSRLDYAVAHRLDISVERVGDALVAAGKRPPVWWIG